MKTHMAAQGGIYKGFFLIPDLAKYVKTDLTTNSSVT